MAFVENLIKMLVNMLLRFFQIQFLNLENSWLFGTTLYKFGFTKQLLVFTLHFTVTYPFCFAWLLVLLI